MQKKKKKNNDVINTSIGAIFGIDKIPKWVYAVLLFGIFILVAIFANQFTIKPVIETVTVSNTTQNVQPQDVISINVVSRPQATLQPTGEVVEGGALGLNTPLPDKIFPTSGPGLSLTQQSPQ